MSLMSQTFTITCSLQFMKRFVKCSHWTPVTFNAKRTSGNFDIKKTQQFKRTTIVFISLQMVI